MDTIIQEIANIGFTLFICVMAMIIVNYLDRNVFSNHKNFKKEKEND